MKPVYDHRVIRYRESGTFSCAPDHQRYVGKFYYSLYWTQWNKVLAISLLGEWHVQAVDVDGNPTAPPRFHRSAIAACSFADRPFNPLLMQNENIVGYVPEVENET